MAFTPNSRNWRFYADDASEPVTPLEAENTAPDITDGVQFRLRWQIHETGNTGANNLTFSFQYYYNSTWYDCSGGSAHFLPYSGQGSEGSLITSFKLTDSDTEGEYTTSNSNVDSIAKNDYHEFDVCLVSEPDNSVLSTSYQFRVLLDGTPVPLESTPHEYPTCTLVAAAAEINMGTAGVTGSAPAITLDVPANISAGTAAVTATSPTLTAAVTTAIDAGTAAVTATSPTLTVLELPYGLQACWYMEEAAGSDRLDSSGNGLYLDESAGNIPQETTTFHQGSASVGPFTTSTLNRGDSALPLTFPLKNGGSCDAFTIGAWFYTTDDSEVECIFTKGTSTARVNAWINVGSGANLIKVYGYLNGTTRISGDVATSNWHHVVLRYDGSTDDFDMAVDNSWGSSATVTSTGTNTSAFVVGTFGTSLNDPWDSGYIDEAFVFDRALTNDQVSTIYGSGLEAFLAGIQTVNMGTAGATATVPAATINRPVVAGVATVTATSPTLTVEAIASIDMSTAGGTGFGDGVTVTSPAITIDAPVNIDATVVAVTATSPSLTIQSAPEIDCGTAAVVATSPMLTISAGPNVSMGTAGVSVTSSALTVERPVVMAAAAVSGSAPAMSVVIPNASLFKLMMHATGSQISDLKVAIVDDGTYPEIDGLILNIQTSTQKTEAQAIAAERPNMRIWRYCSVMDYPFSIAAGLSQHEIWNLKRGSLQFVANSPGAATRQRMVTTSSPYEACLWYAYCVTSPEDEFREMIHWYGITSTLADNFVDGLADLCDDISANCAVFMDQSWMRIIDWMVTDPDSGSCAAVTWQSGHGDTCDETSKYPGSDYSTMESLYGANNWRTWYNNQAYFWAAMDAGIPTDSWNIRNGDFRIDHSQNYDSGLGTYRNLPMPIMVENPHNNVLLTQLYPSYTEAQRFQAGVDFWMQDSRNLLGIFYAGESYKLDDAKDAWTQNTGGWISLLSSGLATPPTDTQMVEALEELITWRESFAVGINCSTAAVTATAEQVTPYMGTVVNMGAAAVTSTAPTLAVDAGPQVSMGTAAVGATAESLAIDAPINLTMTSASAIITGRTITLDVPALVNMAAAEVTATAEDLSIATNVDLLMAMASVTATAPALGGGEGMAGRGYGYLARPRPAPRARPAPVYGVRGRR